MKFCWFSYKSIMDVFNTKQLFCITIQGVKTILYFILKKNFYGRIPLKETLCNNLFTHFDSLC